ncbi:VOC family protein [Sphingomonas kyeonggiensis]|uniref:Catechol 2,3-dioxygenase-like lactoylglutathione lyase family enzyme n=1 Tax=Sphingomonas kyeonggiensis TaxID=1268553 RepID=A0A7W6NX50_9SPHN|nr:VOC family protein [Sphingomonas kyeonggiensis]MBB4098918.1 catechol 2,3-dioxygenase-like lactoylglutathione lyase family enzyme [Sphingomonas kyeonggiensis]
MGFELNHAIVRCTDKAGAARFFAELIDAPPVQASGPFAAVRVNDRLTLDFYDEGAFVFGHFAFLVADRDFDAIQARVLARGLPFGSAPFARDQRINRHNRGRGIYVWDGDGNSYEFFTADPLGGGAA